MYLFNPGFIIVLNCFPKNFIKNASLPNRKDCRIKKISIIHINVSRLCLEIHFFSLIFVHNRDVITSNYNNKCIIYLTRLYVHV